MSWERRSRKSPGMRSTSSPTRDTRSGSSNPMSAQRGSASWSTRVRTSSSVDTFDLIRPEHDCLPYQPEFRVRENDTYMVHVKPLDEGVFRIGIRRYPRGILEGISAFSSRTQGFVAFNHAPGTVVEDTLLRTVTLSAEPSPLSRAGGFTPGTPDADDRRGRPFDSVTIWRLAQKRKHGSILTPKTHGYFHPVCLKSSRVHVQFYRALTSSLF